MDMRLLVAVMLCACSGIDSDPGSGELIATTTQARVVAVGGEYVYYAGDDGLFRTAKAGGSPVRLHTDSSAFHLTADAAGVYWFNSSGVWTIGLTDLTPRQLGGTGNTTLRNFVGDDSAVYYADLSGRVKKTPKAGGGIMEIGMTDTSAGSVALAPEGVWVSTLNGAKLLGSTMELTFGDEFPDDLAWRGGELYVSYAGSGAEDGSVVRVPSTVLADELVLPTSLAATDDALYVTTGNLDAAVRRIPLAGGGSEAIAKGNRPSSLAVDGSHVYWTDPYPGEVRRTAR